MVQDAVTQQMSVALAGPPRLRLYYSARSTSVGAACPSSRAAAAEAQEQKRARKVRVVPGAGEGEAAPTDEPQPAAEEAPPESKENEGQQ